MSNVEENIVYVIEELIESGIKEDSHFSAIDDMPSMPSLEDVKNADKKLISEMLSGFVFDKFVECYEDYSKNLKSANMARLKERERLEKSPFYQRGFKDGKSGIRYEETSRDYLDGWVEGRESIGKGFFD